MMEFQPHVTAEDLHKLNVPVLVISTDRDVVEEEHTFFIYKNIPKVNLSIISEESHYVVRRNPELFNSVVFKFLIEPYRINSFRFDK